DAQKRGRSITTKELLRTALFRFVTAARTFLGAKTSQNIVLRDVDHYFAGRLQEWRKELLIYDQLASTSSPLSTRPGLFAAEIYDSWKRHGFEKVTDPDKPNAHFGGEENPDPAAAPGGRLWAELGGEHSEAKDDLGKVVTDPTSLHVKAKDLENLRRQ